jgi:ribosome-binding factor A
MENRVPGVNQLIKRELSGIILKEIEFPQDTLVTLTRVETSSNLIESKIYVSVIPESRQDAVMKLLRGQVYFLQQLLNDRLRMRPIPKIIFVKEEETVRAGKVEELLEELKREKK